MAEKIKGVPHCHIDMTVDVLYGDFVSGAQYVEMMREEILKANERISNQLAFVGKMTCAVCSNVQLTKRICYKVPDLTGGSS